MHVMSWMMSSQVLDGFQGLLHEFRSLQQELGPWTAAFQEQHARKPRMTDVEKTGEAPYLLMFQKASLC